MPLKSGDLANVISDCYQRAGTARHDRPAGRHEPTGLPRKHAERTVVRHRRPGHPGLQGRSSRRRKEGARIEEAVRAWCDHRGRAVQPGARRLDPRSGTDHHGNDGRDEGGRPWLPRLRQPGLPHGALGRPWRCRADSPAGRHARSDGQADGRDHRNAHQGQLPRRLSCWSTSARPTAPERVWPTRP
jgi:hypothetical protein